MSPSKKRQVRSLLFVSLFFAGLFLVVHNPSLDRGFMLDDYVYLTEKFAYLPISFSDMFLSIKSRHYAPLNFAVNIMLFRATELSPFVMHGINLFVFYLTALVLYHFVKKLTSPSVAWITALVYALHPVNADLFGMVFMNSVLLMNLLVLCSLSLYVEYARSHRLFPLLVSLLLFIISLFLQELSVLLPAAVFLLSLVYFRQSFRKSVVQSAPYGILAAGFLALWFYFSAQKAAIGSHYEGLTLNAAQYIGYFFELIGWYLQVLILIKNPVFIYSIYTKMGQPAWQWILIIPALFTAAFYIAHRYLKSRAALFGLLLFLVGLMPAIPGSLVHSYMGMVIEPYWFIFTSVGAFLFAGEALSALFNHLSRPVKLSIQIAGLLILIISTIHVHYAGRHEKRYSEYWLKQNPHNTIALMSLAFQHREQGELEESAEVYARVLEIESSASVYSALASVRYYQGNLDQAEALISQALALNSGHAEAHHILGLIHWDRGHLAAAEESFLTSLHYDPYYLLAARSLAALLLENGKEADALWTYETILQRFGPFPGREKIEETVIRLQNGTR